MEQFTKLLYFVHTSKNISFELSPRGYIISRAKQYVINVFSFFSAFTSHIAPSVFLHSQDIFCACLLPYAARAFFKSDSRPWSSGSLGE